MFFLGLRVSLLQSASVSLVIISPSILATPTAVLIFVNYCLTVENSLQAVYKQLKMVEKEVQFLVDQLEAFDLFPLVRPVDYIDPWTDKPDPTWLYPCKVSCI